MPKISLGGFQDPRRRPRYILWTFVAALVLAAVMITALGVTSTRWFCSEGCHKVQDDTITAYEHSTHAEISCMACHMPVGANPATFLLHKAEALGELYMTLTNSYELPLNAESELALTMPSAQCTQCHDTAKRLATPTPGVLIDHDVHAEKDVECAICHNRIAHNEDFNLALVDPKSQKTNSKHQLFTTMTACFRCHSQGETPEGGLEAPGACPACHPADFQLKPESHLAPGFFPGGHARLAAAEASRSLAAQAAIAGEQAAAAERQHGKSGGIGPELPTVEAINECSTCHAKKFCDDCHGVPMPHPADFMKTHGEAGKKTPAVCAKCHGDVQSFCDACHHGKSLNVEYTAGRNWRKLHPRIVSLVGASSCLDPCHNPVYCADCHVNGPPD